MSFPYKKVLIIGATSGIGRAYAEKVVQAGSYAIIVGRRKENLDDFVQQHGEDNVDSFVLDITQLDQIPSFASAMTSKHPDLDCVILNAGIQRGFDFAKPETVDLELIGMELTTNYLAYVHLTHAFIPFLQKQGRQTCLVYVSSGLGLVPVPRVLNYAASKAALHNFVLCLREQLRDGPGNIKVVEIIPPAVRTELHDVRNQPDLEGQPVMGIPLDVFTEESWAGLLGGEEQVPVAFIKAVFEKMEGPRMEFFQSFVQMTKRK